MKNDDGEILFAVGQSGLGITILPKVHFGQWYKPLPESRVYWNLPPTPIEYPSLDFLFERNRKFIYDYADVKEPGAYEVLAAFALATWRFEDWPSFPYLFFLGHYGAGKSTLQRILKQICRRAVGGPSITTAALVSMMDRYQATVCLDEAQIYNSEDKQEAIALLRGAYQKDNLRIKQVGIGQGGWTDKSYKASGFIIISSHDPLEEGIMQRCLPFSMVKRTRRLSKWRKPDFEIEGSSVRGMNLQYRLLNIGDPIPEDVEKKLEEIHDDRLQELALPLLTVTPEKYRETILSFFQRLEKRKQLQTESSDEADYFEVFDFLTTEEGKTFLMPVGKPRILFSEFKKKLVDFKKAGEPDFDAKYLGGPKSMWKVIERLGFHHGGHTREGSTIAFDPLQVEALRPLFKPDTDTIPQKPVTTVTPVTPIEKQVTDVMDVTVLGYRGIPNPTVSKEVCSKCFTRKYIELHATKSGPPITGVCEDCGQLAAWMIQV